MHRCGERMLSVCTGVEQIGSGTLVLNAHVRGISLIQG